MQKAVAFNQGKLESNDVETRKKGIFAQGDNRPPENHIEEERQRKLQAQTSLKFPSDLTDQLYTEFNAFKINQDRPSEAKRTFQFTKSIYLPFPSSVTDQYGASWNREDLFFGGEAMRQGLNEAMKSADGTKSVENIFTSGTADKLGNAVSRGINKFAADPTGALKTGLAVGGTYALTGMGGPLASAAKASFNVTTNPYPVMTFQGTGFKSFGFSWTFYPESKKESETIKKIIGYFRREMLPETLKNTPSIMANPAIFEVFINPDIKQFKRCVITGLDVNYTPAGPAFVKEFPLKDGSPFLEPAAITMSISLQEIEIWTANDFYADEDKDFDFIRKDENGNVTQERRSGFR